MYEELANLLFPNLPLTVEEIEEKYKARELKKEHLLQDLVLVLLDLCM